MGGFDLIHKDQLSVLFIIKFHRAPAIAAVPETVVAFASVRCFIVYEEHILLFTKDLRFHHGMDVLLAHMPDNQIILFIKGEIRFHQQMQLREIKVILLAFIPEHTQQSAIQWDEVDLRSTSANIEYAILQQLPGLFASQATGGEPDPGGCEIPAPVLIRVSETFLRCDNILLSIQDDCSAEGALHALKSKRAQLLDKAS